jgi:hypothetical protein
MARPQQASFSDTTSVSDKVVVGVFHSRDKAEAAIDDLLNSGFVRDQIGVVARNASGEWDDLSTTDAKTSAAATGAAAGVATGAGVGGLWALGIAAGMLPAIGPIVAGGILGSLLASAAAGAAAGGVIGAFLGLGFSEDEAKYYEGEVNSGRTLVTVKAGDRATQANTILRAHGATDAQGKSATEGARSSTPHQVTRDF